MVFETKYNKDMPKKIIETFKLGKLKAQVCAAIGISHETMNQWCNSAGKYYRQDISEAVQYGLTLSEARNLEDAHSYQIIDKEGPRLDTKLWSLRMRNAFPGWNEKVETVHSAGEGVTFHMDLTGKKDD